MSESKENFEQLLEESFERQDFKLGEVIAAEVIAIDSNYVTIDAGLKSEPLIPIEEFKNDMGELEAQVGDFVPVVVESLENGYGETKLSREKAKRMVAWGELEEAQQKGITLTGVVSGRVKGGLTVMVNGIRAFLPGSLVDTKSMKESSILEEKQIEFKVIKLDKKKNNVVLSRRAVLEESMFEERKHILDNLTEGSIVKGIVKNVTDYGVFVDLGGIDGLLHITDIAWRRVKHPNEVLNIGDEITTRVLKFDRDKNRVSLGMKQLGDDPWVGLSHRYPPNTRIFGKVTNLPDYGAFVEIEQGIEGLVHASEMDWTNRNVHPSKVISLGDEVEVMILEIDEERRRISLGMKQCQPNPWEEFANNHKMGDRISGKIKSITDFGIFVGLDGGIDGLVHLSDISWVEDGIEALRKFKKGDEIEAIILSIDVERERISMSIKDLESDPFVDFASKHDKNDVVRVVLKAVDSKGGFVVSPVGFDSIEGLIPAAEVPRDEDSPEIGEEFEAMIIYLDKKLHSLKLSLKAKINADFADVRRALKESSDPQAGRTNLGDILRDKLKEGTKKD